MRAALLVASIAMASCATQQNFSNYLNAWIGQPEQSIISGWGIPTQIYESGAYRYIQYSGRSDTGFAATTLNVGNNPWLIGQSRAATCEVTFTLQGGVVTTWRSQGNACTM